MGGNVADYKVLTGSTRVRLGTGVNKHTFGPFSLPGDTITGQDGLVSYNIVGSSGAPNGPGLNLIVNEQLLSGTFAGLTGLAIRTVQEAILPGLLIDGPGNTVTFELSEGSSGSVDINNVVIWFQNAT